MRNYEKMSIDEPWKYLKLVAPRYGRANKAERSRLLAEIGSVTGLHRKSLIRLMGMPILRAPKEAKVEAKTVW